MLCWKRVGSAEELCGWNSETTSTWARGDAENTLPSTSGRDIQKCYPGRKATYLPEEVICFKKFLQGRWQLSFFLLLAADCIWSSFIFLVQLFPVCVIVPLRFCAILDFLLWSGAGSGLHSSSLWSQRDCLVWGWSYPVWTKEYKRDQVLGKSVLELRFIVTGLKRDQGNPVDLKTRRARSERSSRESSPAPVDGCLRSQRLLLQETPR